jgi:hypothetical protein
MPKKRAERTQRNSAGESEMSSFGFDKVKKPAEQGERKLDLSGLTMQTPPVSADKEQRAIEKGEELGFTSREPTETKERKRGREGDGNAPKRANSDAIPLCPGPSIRPGPLCGLCQ